MGAKDISLWSLIMITIVLLIPLAAGMWLRLRITRKTLYSVGRMVIQLFAVGGILKYIFNWNNYLITLAWIVFMMIAASFSIIKGTSLKVKYFFTPVLMALILSNVFVLLYFNMFVISLTNIFDARYVIVIMGMLLGNSLKGNIVGIDGFYKDVRRNENRYLYQLSAGATKREALIPYLRKNLLVTLNPTIATMATTGIVSLPGMMTGQILGGSDPMVAIKYQIAIMISIFASSALSILLTIFFTVRNSFDEYGILKKEIFR